MHRHLNIVVASAVSFVAISTVACADAMPDGMVFEYSSGVREIADELLYRERQFPFEPKGFCEWGAKPQIKEFRNRMGEGNSSAHGNSRFTRSIG